MELDRATIVHQQFINRVKRSDFPDPTPSMLHQDISEPDRLVDLFDSQIKSRLLDIVARELKRNNASYYTIGSSGHEGNAAFGAVFRPKDMAFLHYRSGGFYIQRAKSNPSIDPIKDMLLSLVASSDDPISAGRHKVFGSVPLNIPPQTSTIASHLPKALGAAIAITRAKELKLKATLDPDAVILCSFGDASLNHAVTQTTLNASAWIAEQSYPLPLVFICEDNGIGISVPTPKNWVYNTIINRPNIHYIACDGLNLANCVSAAKEAAHVARTQKKIVFLHMTCVRLLGHAGSDIESQYLSLKAIEQTEANDPLLHSAGLLYRAGLMSAEDILSCYTDNYQHIQSMAKGIVTHPKLTSATAVMASIIPPKQRSAPQLPTEAIRERCFGTAYKKLAQSLNLCQSINFALTDAMAQYANVLVFGEDVAKKGGVYHVTSGLEARFGKRRVFNTLLDETTILGTSIGLAHNGFLPIPEIQFWLTCIMRKINCVEKQLRYRFSPTVSIKTQWSFVWQGLLTKKVLGGTFITIILLLCYVIYLGLLLPVRLTVQMQRDC